MKELFSIILSILAPVATTIGAITIGLAVVAIVAAVLIALFPLRRSYSGLYVGSNI